MQLPFIFAHFLRDLNKNKMPPGNLHHLQMAYNERIKIHREQHNNIFSMSIFWVILASHKAIKNRKNPARKYHLINTALASCTICRRKAPFYAPLNAFVIITARLYSFFGTVIFHMPLSHFYFPFFISWLSPLPCALRISPVRPIQFRLLRFSVVSSIGRFQWGQNAV